MMTKRLTLNELIDREARKLALESFMETNKISPDKPLPPDTEIQVEALLSSSDLFQLLAKKNVLAQKAAHDEALRAIGLDPIEVDPLELDL